MFGLLKAKPAPEKTGGPVQIPDWLRARIHIDQVDEVVFVDEDLRTKRPLLIWLADARHHPELRRLEVQWEPISTVAERAERAHNEGGTASTAVSRDADVRDEALAMLREGAENGVSDIHIHRKERHTEILFRINGTLVVAREMFNDHADRLMRATYTLATSRESAYSEMEPQDGAIAGEILKGTGLANVRIVRGPCLPVSEGGKFMVLRLQYASSGARRATKAEQEEKAEPGEKTQRGFRVPRKPEGHLRLSEYGFSPEQADRLLAISIAPSGILIATGPTGSGKTTTLFQLAQHKARSQPGRRLVTIEQPAEYPMPWGIQLDISNALGEEAAGKEFRSKQRNALRMDPDDMILGEMRDKEVSLTTFEAAQTGHFVMTTMHVDDAFDYPLRLQGMDFERLSFRTTCNASIVRGIIAQRLLPVLCQHCCIPWTVADDRIPRRTCEAIPSWGDDLSTIRRMGPGCEKCHGTGITGRTAVAEVVETDEELMSDFVKHGVAIARHRFRARAGVDPSMVETALSRAFAGLVDPLSITAVVDRIRPRDVVMAERAAGARTAA